MLEHGARLAGAADHAQEQEWPVNPLLEHERVVPMPAGDDESKARHCGQWQRQQLLPYICLQRDFWWEELIISQCGAVVEDGYAEVQLQGERRNGLGDVPGPGNPKRAWCRDCFRIE